MPKIKVGPLTFRVKIVEDLEDTDGKDLWGHVKYTTGEILLEKNMIPERRAVTIWHEITHIIFEQSGHSVTEELIDAIAYGFYGVLKDNPKLINRIWNGE